MATEPVIYWKRIWQIVSGHIKNVTREEVQETCFSVKNELLTGILHYTTSTTADRKWSEDIERFLKRTSIYLKVDITIAWDILRSYIVNEFCGSMKCIQKLKYEIQILPMLNHIWKFYTLERMFKLRTIKVILEYMKDNEHPYCDIYVALIEELGYRNIWKSLVSQFEYLINEITATVVDNDYPMKLWMERNMREEIDILHCLIILVEYASVTIVDVKELLVLFKVHGFGREPTYFNAVSVIDPSSICQIRYAEIALFICLANQFWSSKESWQENSSILNDEITPLTYHEEHGAVMYIWVVLHMVLPNAEELFSTHFHKLTQRALNLKVFNFFHKIASHEMFQPNSLIGNNVQEAMYNLLYITCNKFDGDGTLFNYNGVVPLTTILLKNKHLSERLFKEDDAGVTSLWNTSLELFPYDFLSLSNFSEAIISANDTLLPKVMKELNELQIFAEIYNMNLRHTPRRQQYDSVITLEEWFPQAFPALRIPPRTEAVIVPRSDINLVHFKTRYSYWFILKYHIRFVLHHSLLSNTNIQNILAGLKLLLAILKVQEKPVKIYPFLKEIIALSISIINKFADTDNAPLSLLAVCLDISSELIQNYGNFIYPKLESLQAFPRITKDNFAFEEMFKLDFLDTGLVGRLILQGEKHYEQQMLLTSYLNFLRSSFKFSKGNLTFIELPGLVFLLKEIVPHFMFWYSKQDSILQDVLYQCIHFLFEIFQLPETKLDDKVYSHMRNITFQSFLNESCGRCLLKVLASGNTGVMQIMQNQTNWQTGRGIRYISIVQKVMSMLMQLLTLRKTVTEVSGLTPLENLIYTENDSIKVVKAVASFLNHPFNEAIPNLACRLLKKFTIELQMSMLASLELEPDQIRIMFIQRMRDHLECEELKLAIVELITASIPKQSGMTEAFFKVSEPSVSKQNKLKDSAIVNYLDEGIGSFLVEYLMKFNSDDSQMHITLVSRIMELLYVLWTNQKEILIVDLIKDKQFWPLLCNPLFKQISFSNKTYAELLNIIAKEVHKKGGNVDETLLDILTLLFSCNRPYLDYWINHIFSSTDKMNEIDKAFAEDPSMSSLVIAWKDFLIIAIKLLPSHFFPQEVQLKLTRACRNALKQQILYLDDSCSLTILAELYLFFLTTWKESCIKDHNEVFVDITNMLQKISLTYQDLPKRFQESIIAITVLLLYKEKSSTALNSVLGKSLIKTIVKIFDHEYELLSYHYDNNLIDDKYFENKKHNSFIMCFAALNKLIMLERIFNNVEYNTWLSQMQIVSKLISCTKRFLKKRYTLPFAKIAIETLVYYAESNNSADFFYVDIALLLWENLVPPKEYRQPVFHVTVRTLPWDLKVWWTIYRRVLMLLTILLKKHTYLILKEILMFVSLHKDYIAEVLLIQRYSVDGIALDLIITTLCFLHELLKYSNAWRDDHEESLLIIMDSLKAALNCSTAVIIRPNVLRYFILNSSGKLETPSFESVPTEAVVDVVDKLTDIVILVTRCILQFSPPLYNMLRDTIDYQKWGVQVGTSFGIPKLGVDDSSELTFGSLLCVSCLYVRILQQILSTKRPPAASREILVPRKSRLNLSSPSKADDTRSTKPNPADMSDEKNQNKSVSEQDSDNKIQDCLSEIKRKSLKPVREIVIGFIRLDYYNPTCNLNFATYTTPPRLFPWFMNLNEERAINALELILSLLATQVSLVTIHNNIDKRECRFIRRELCSELQIFHEFVQKKLTDSYRYNTLDQSCFVRRKLGSLEIDKVDENDSKKDSASKKVHFNNDNDKVQSRGHTGKRSIESEKSFATPSSSSLTISSVSENEDRTTAVVSRQIKSASQLYEVKLAAEDYLQLLSNWFMYVIRTHK